MSSASATHPRPLLVHQPRMDRKHRGNPEARARPGASPNQSQQTLPSFRELLPPHLHDAIDRSQSDVALNQRTSAAASPNYQSSPALANSQDASRSRGMPSISQGFDEYAGRYQTPPSAHPPSGRQAMPPISSGSYGASPEMSNAYRTTRTLSQPYPSQQSSPSLPPFREIQSYSDRALAGEDRYISSSTGYPNTYNLTQGMGIDSDKRQYSSSGQGFPETDVPSTTPYGHSVSGFSEPYDSNPHDMDSRSSMYSSRYSDIDNANHGPGAQGSSTFGIMGSDLDARNKRRRGNLPKPVTDILRKWFHAHLDHPYPSEEDKQMFIARTGLTMSQISNWFINARRRQLPALRNQVRAQDSDRLNFEQSMSDLEHPDSHESSISPRSR